ncbi:MAG: ferrous iron transport protein B [Muribaculaceae bacterium]
MTRLSNLKTGEKATIVKILGYGAFRKRVVEMGFVRGHEVEVVLNAPLHDPIKYKILNYEVSLRRSEADLIEVVTDAERSEDMPTARLATISDTDRVTVARHRHSTINIALIGNPNCGKTSLFNIASGGKERVGNYSGVTVDAKEGFFTYKDFNFKVVDLPGTYSLSAYSPEELYVRRYLKEEIPDVIVNVLDGSNLTRNLYLTTELIDMDRSMVIALNMYDELKASGATFDYEAMGKMIGVPIVPTVSKTGEGLTDLLDAIISVYEGTHDSVRHVHVRLGQETEEAIGHIKDEIKASGSPILQFSPRYLAIKMLEGDNEVEEMLKPLPNYAKIAMVRNKWVAHIEDVLQEDIATDIASEKYGFIAGALRETYIEGNKKTEGKRTDIIDAIVTNRWLGFPIFIMIMFLMFWTTFEVGAYPMDWIGAAVDRIAGLVDGAMDAGPLKDLIVDGVIGGVGGVIVFLPNILILYFFISFMEDSGYMARAAFIMDKIMHKMGLHGKSFIPLVMGFGCNVPAIMSTRIIESKSSRIITMLVNPFMSCSARLPIFVLFVSAFFPDNAAIVFMGLYMTGIVMAIVTARLLRHTLFKHDETPFVMELPPYRFPSMKSAMHHMWEKTEQYIHKMGTIILVGSIAVWALNYFPRDLDKSNDEMTAVELEHQQENSYLASIGKFMTPFIEPLGLNWKASIALISGTTAKEIVVSTLGVLYTVDESDGDGSMMLQDRLAQPDSISGKPDFTLPSALSFMVFVLLYFPCIATIAAIVRESGSWKYGIFSICYNTALAWVVAFATYRICLLFV